MIFFVVSVVVVTLSILGGGTWFLVSRDQNRREARQRRLEGA